MFSINFLSLDYFENPLDQSSTNTKQQETSCKEAG